MATNKKQQDIDYTNQPQAKTADDVNNQDSRTRLWQSLNTGYTRQMEESDKAYDKAISQQDNAMLARGMGRSSYADQTRANLYTEKSNARSKLGEALIADYQNRIGDIENQEKEDERWERQFAETQKQNEWQRQYQEGEAARAQGNWEKEYEANRSDTAWSQNFQQGQLDYQKAQDELAQQNWQKQFDYQQSQDALSQQNWEIQQAFNEQQWQAQQEQWREEFDYNKMTNDQKIAFEVITAALAAGNDADDATLKRAGISRAEFNTMKQKAASGTGSTTYWRSLGFNSEKDYSAARKAGQTAQEYYAGKNGNGNGNGNGNTASGLIADMANSVPNNSSTTVKDNSYLIDWKWDRNGNNLIR